jgi:hypothetical protein
MWNRWRTLGEELRSELARCRLIAAAGRKAGFKLAQFFRTNPLHGSLSAVGDPPQQVARDLGRWDKWWRVAGKKELVG